MIRFPNSKINLGLHILEKLPDGYHRLETVFYPVGLSDILEIIPSSSGETRLTVSGVDIPGDPKENLCLQAWQLLKKAYGIRPVEMHLHKIIPVGSGLGGGSADAAFALSMINDLFELELPVETLREMAFSLGMDCPFFILDEPSVGTGKGEILQPVSVSLKGFYIVVVMPEVHVSTAEAYSGVKPAINKQSVSQLIQNPVDKWKNLLINDFEETVFQKYPQIRKIKEELYAKKAVYASMSGSGSSVYGLFREKTDLTGCFESWFVWQGIL